MFDFVRVGCVEGPLLPFSWGWRFGGGWFGGAVCFILSGLVVWRGRFFHLVWVAALEGPLVFVRVGCVEGPLLPFSWGWRFGGGWFGGAVCFILSGLVVWRGRFFHLVWVAALEGPLV